MRSFVSTVTLAGFLALAPALLADDYFYVDDTMAPLASVSDLAQEFLAQRSLIEPMYPPDLRQVIQPVDMSVLASLDGFPTVFRNGLIGADHGGLAAYPVTCIQVRGLDSIVFLNAANDVIGSMPYTDDSIWNRTAWSDDDYDLQSRDPARVGLTLYLVTPANLAAADEAAELQAEIDAAAASESDASSDGLSRMGGMQSMNSMQSLLDATYQHLKFAGIRRVTNGMELTVGLPDGWSNRVAVLANTDLVDSAWGWLTNLDDATNGVSFTWVDTNFSNLVRRYYVPGNADSDGDADGISDFIELYVTKTSLTNIDTDADGLVDGYSGIVPTNAYPAGVTTNGGQFVEGEMTWGTDPAKWDTDDDGTSDGWEVAHGHNPLDPNDPPNVRGTIGYSGGQTGPVIVVAVETADSWATNNSVRLNTPGPYRIPNLTATNYWIKAYRDSNSDNSNGLAEAWGMFYTNAIGITNKVVGISFSLLDPDVNTNSIPDWWEIAHFGSTTNSGARDDPDGDQYTNLEEYQAGTDPNDISNHPWNVSGTVSYAGPQTGTIWVVASASSDSWIGACSNSISQPGAYTITHLPPNTNYWIWAWRDTDGDGEATYWEAYGAAAANPVYLSGNCTNIDVTLTDSDSDGDGLPDWWEVQYGLDPFDGIRSDAAGWWQLDASSGTNVLDSSANGNHGVLWNAASNAWTSGVVSNALALDGTNAYVQLTNSASLQPSVVSVALWMRPDRDYTNGSAAFFSKRVSGGSAGYSLGYENGKLAFTVCASGAKAVQLPCALSNGVWRHVAGTYGGQYQRLYVDGALAVETNYNWGTGSADISQDAVNPRIGATADATASNRFAGTLDDVLVFGQELSINRVSGLYQEGADFDHDGLSNWQEFHLNTDPNVNNPPIASNDTFTANENATLLISAPGILTNDSTLGSYNLTAELVSGITGLTCNANGSFTYVPPANWYGVTSFTYRAFNGWTNSAAATVAIFVYSNSVFAWGANYFGECDVPTTATNVIAVSAGDYHSMALRGDGTVIVWENNGGFYDVPVLATNIIAISAGAQHNLALKANGAVFAWGDNYSGQTNVPASATNVIAISAGGYHSLALCANGAVFAWGDNSAGQTNVPVSASNVIAISAGGYHSLALRSNGTVVAWGAHYYGQTNVPVSATNVIAISAGSYHSLALRRNGAVVAWGYSGYGATNVPTSATNVIAISASEYYSMALKNDGTVIAWGKNDYGQTTVPDGLQATAIDAGGYHALAIGKIIKRPVASNDTYTVDENTTLDVYNPGVLTNDFDPSSFPITAQLVSRIAGLILNTDGSFTYNPPANWHGVTNFTYLASNSLTNSTVATVTIVVNPVTSINYAPTCDADTNQIALAGTNGLAMITLAGTGSDIDGIIALWTWNTNGTQIATGQTAVVGLPIGSNSISLVVTDNGGLTATDTVTILVLDPNGDSDNDGLPDGWEMTQPGYNPLVPNSLEYGQVIITSPLGAWGWNSYLGYCYSITQNVAVTELDNTLSQGITGIANSDAITSVLIIVGTTSGHNLRRYTAPVTARHFSYAVPLLPGNNYITVYGEYTCNGVKLYTGKDSRLVAVHCQQIPTYDLSMEFESNVACTNTVQPIFDALVQWRYYGEGGDWTILRRPESPYDSYPTACWSYPWYGTWDGSMKTITVPSNLSTYRFDVHDDCQDTNTHNMTMRIIVNEQTIHTETRTDISNKTTNDIWGYDTALKGGVFTGPRLGRVDGFSVNGDDNLALLPPLTLVGYHYQTPVSGYSSGIRSMTSNGIWGMTTTYPMQWYGMTNMTLTGPNGTEPVSLEYGQSAQFTATGTLMVDAPGAGIVSNFPNVNVVDCIGGGDEFGVFNGHNPGDFVVSCAGCATTIAVHVADAPMIASLDLDMDTDRNGTIDLNNGDDVGEDDWTLQRGSLIIPAACELDVTNDVRGLSQLIVRGTTAVGIGQVLRLSIIKGDALELYLLNSTGTVVTSSAEYNIPGSYTNDRIFYLAARLPRYGATGTNMDYLVQLQLVNAGNQILKSDTVRCKVAPMILPWDGNPVEKVYATGHITDFPSATNIPNLVVVTNNDAQWAQDFVKPAKVQWGSGVAADVVADLDHWSAGNFVERLKQTETNVVVRATPWNVGENGGEGGNIMISPPLPDAPYGKAIVGHKHVGSLPYFVGQAIQTNVIILTNDWLLVGHVDEVISFVDSNRVLVADPWTAANILHAAITNGNGTNIIWYGATPLSDPETKKSFLEVAVATNSGGTFKTNALPSPGLSASTTNCTLTFANQCFSTGDYVRVDNEICRVETINGTQVTLSRQWGGSITATHASGTLIYALTDILRWNLPLDSPCVHTNMVNLTNSLSTALGSYSITYVKLPVLFDKKPYGFIAGTANVVNCLVYPSHGVYMQDTGNPDFNDYVNTNVSGVVFINIWDGYHCHQGEVHCGTATRRTINLTPPWWEKVVGWQ